MMRTFSEFLKEYRKIEKLDKDGNELKIAILSSFTIKGMKEIITVMCRDEGIYANVYEGSYGQYAQEVYLSHGLSNSDLISFAPHMTVFLLDLENICPDYLSAPYSFTEKQRKDIVKVIKNDIKSLINAFLEKNTGSVILNNFSIPHYSPLGIAEQKQEFGFLESIETLNTEFREEYKKSDRVYIFDFNSFSGRNGKTSVRDMKLYYQGDIKISFSSITLLCKEYMPYFRSITGKVKKCLVVDLDNTLWVTKQL